MRRLHDVIVWNAPSDHVLGPTWEQIHGLGPVIPAGGPPWWQERRDELQRIAREHGSAYVYDRASLGARREASARDSRRRPHLLRDEGEPAPGAAADALPGSGSSFECVSRGECERVLEVVPGIDPGPHPVHAELRAAQRIRVGARAGRPPDARQPVRAARMGRAVPRPRRAGPHRHRLRPRPPRSRAHGGRAFQVRHPAVRDGRARAPGRSRRARASSACMRIPAAACSTCATGRKSGQLLGGLAQRFPHARAIDLGGGLGVPEKPGQVPVDLAALQGVIDEHAREVAAARSLARAGPVPRGARRACWSRR